MSSGVFRAQPRSFSDHNLVTGEKNVRGEQVSERKGGNEGMVPMLGTRKVERFSRSVGCAIGRKEGWDGRIDGRRSEDRWRREEERSGPGIQTSKNLELRAAQAGA